MIEKISCNNWQVFGVILLLGILAYAYILPTPFKTLDDYVSIVQNETIQDINLTNIKNIFTNSFFESGAYYRPLIYLSFMLEYHFFKLNSFFYNLTNIILHCISSMAVFCIISRLLKNRVTAFLTAVIFAIHPIHWEAITNIPGRSILLCAMFFLWAFYFYTRALSEEKPFCSYCIALTCFIFSLLSKETAVMLPFVILSYQIFFSNQCKSKLIKYGGAMDLLIILGIYFFIRRTLDITAGFHWIGWDMTFLNVMSFLNSCFIHISLLVFPIEFYYDRSHPLFFSFFNPEMWYTLLVYIAIGTGLFIKRKHISREAWFLICWAVLNMATVSQLIPVKISTFFISAADHFLYLSSISVFVLLVYIYDKIFVKLTSRQTIKPLVIKLLGVVFLIFLFLTTVQQAVYSRQQIAMFKRTLEQNPNNERVRSSLATAYGLAGLHKEAEREYRKVLEINQNETRAIIGLGVSLCNEGRCFDALREYDQITDAGQSAELLEHNRNIAIRALVEQYLERLESDPNDIEARYSLGVMYARLGDIEKAVQQYNMVLAAQPNHKFTLLNLADWYHASGQREKALTHYQRALNAFGEYHEQSERIQEMINQYVEEANF